MNRHANHSNEEVRDLLARYGKLIDVLDFAFKTVFILAALALATDVFAAWYSGAFDRLVR